MKAFLASIVALVVISVAAALVLGGLDNPAEEAYAVKSSVRVGEVSTRKAAGAGPTSAPPAAAATPGSVRPPASRRRMPGTHR